MLHETAQIPMVIWTWSGSLFWLSYSILLFKGIQIRIVNSSRSCFRPRCINPRNVPTTLHFPDFSMRPPTAPITTRVKKLNFNKIKKIFENPFSFFFCLIWLISYRLWKDLNHNNNKKTTHTHTNKADWNNLNCMRLTIWEQKFNRVI